MAKTILECRICGSDKLVIYAVIDVAAELPIRSVEKQCLICGTKMLLDKEIDEDFYILREGNKIARNF